MAPLFSPSGLVYRYVVESTDRSAMELKVIQDWVLEQAYKSVPGVADMSSLGGETMQYQVLIDPDAAGGRGALGADGGGGARRRTTATPAAASTPRADSSTTCAASGASQTLEDIGNVVVAVHNGTPVLVKDIGDGGDRRTRRGSASSASTTGTTPSKASILMRTGEQAQTVLKGVEAKTRELNDSHPAEGREGACRSTTAAISIALTTRTVEDNLLRGIVLVIVDPDLLPVRRSRRG